MLISSKATQMICLLSVSMLIAVFGVSAQPTDAELKKQLTSAKTVSVELGGPGRREWSTTYKKYMWSRNFKAKLRTDDPDVFLIVTGYAAYDVRGNRYVFWRTFTSSNSYEGIPNPTAAEIDALINKWGASKFMRSYYFNRVVGKVESIGMVPDTDFEWHTPNSVSFDLVAVYTEKTNDIGGTERGARTYRIRLYRDDTKSEWKNLVTSDKSWKKL